MGSKDPESLSSRMEAASGLKAQAYLVVSF